MSVRINHATLVDDLAVTHTGDFVLDDDGSWRPAGAGDSRLETIEGSHLVVTRTLQNWHTHLGMLLMRGAGEGLPLMEWLNGVIFPMEQHISEEDVVAGTRAAAAEMIRTGSSFACDMYYWPRTIADVMSQAGLRALVTGVVTDFPTPSYPGGAADSLAQFERLLATTPPPGIQYGIGTHAVYTCSDDTLRAARDLADRFGVPLHVHVAETDVEYNDCRERTGQTPTAHLAELGILRPGTVAAHCCWLDDADRDTLAATGAIAVNCATSNMKLATGRTTTVTDLLDRGVDVALGTDGAASNNVLDMRQEAKVATLLERHHAHDSALIPPERAWRLATRGSQDWVTWGLDDIRMTPRGSDSRRVLGNLVYSGADCRDMWVRGRAVRRDGVTLTVDETGSAAHLEQRAAGLESFIASQTPGDAGS